MLVVVPCPVSCRSSSVLVVVVFVVVVLVVVVLVVFVRSCRRRRRSRSSTGRRIVAARVGLPLLREGERAADLLLRVRVVEHVGRELRDRLAVALERVDLADAAVVVPVGDHLVGARLLPSPSAGPLASAESSTTEHEQEAEAQGAMRGERSKHDAGGRNRGCRGVWQVSRLPLSRWCVQGKRIVSLGAAENRPPLVVPWPRHGRGPTRDAIRRGRRRTRGGRRPPRLGLLRRRRLGHGRDRDARDGRRARRRRCCVVALGARAASACPASTARAPSPAAAAVGLVAWTGLDHLVVDRGRPLLGRAREGDRRARLRRRRPRGRAACPGGPLRTLALLLAGPARRACSSGRCSARRPGARPGRRRPRRPAEGLGRLLERARAARGRRPRPRPLAPRLGARAPRPPAGALLLYAATLVDPADPVPRRPARGRSPSSRSRSSSSEQRVEAALLGAARRRARPFSSRAGPSRGPPSSRTAARARTASPTAPCSACCSSSAPSSRSCSSPASRSSASSRRGGARSCAASSARSRSSSLRRARSASWPASATRSPGPAHQLGGSGEVVERPRPARQPRDEQPHRLVGRGVAGLPRQPGRGNGRPHVRDRAQALPRQRAERDRAAQRAAAAARRRRRAGVRPRARVRRRARARAPRLARPARAGRARRRRRARRAAARVRPPRAASTTTSTSSPSPRPTALVSAALLGAGRPGRGRAPKALVVGGGAVRRRRRRGLGAGGAGALEPRGRPRLPAGRRRGASTRPPPRRGGPRA